MVERGFGLVHLKGEGLPSHPDDIANECDMSDEQYLRQLQAYKDQYGLDTVMREGLIRDRLLPELK